MIAVSRVTSPVELGVTELGGEDNAELTAFLDALGSGSNSVLGYHYPFYRDMLRSIEVGEPHYLAARRDGKVTGVLPFFVKTSAAGTVMSSLPYFGPNGGVLCAGADRHAVHALLLSRVAEIARERNALSCSIYTPFGLEDFELYDRTLKEWRIVEKFSQYQNLFEHTRDPAVGRNLRKALRLGVEVSTDVTPERLNAFYRIYEKNCGEFAIPLKPRACIDYLARPEFIGSHTRFYFALREGEILGALLMIWSPKVASYYIPCSITEAREYQPSTVLIDAAMTEARARGVQIWNWESSPARESGVYRFKKKWGAVEGRYRIYFCSFGGEARLRALGRIGIAREFPYYFVWPFDRL